MIAIKIPAVFSQEHVPRGYLKNVDSRNDFRRPATRGRGKLYRQTSSLRHLAKIARRNFSTICKGTVAQRNRPFRRTSCNKIDSRSVTVCFNYVPNISAFKSYDKLNVNFVIEKNFERLFLLSWFKKKKKYNINFFLHLLKNPEK